MTPSAFHFPQSTVHRHSNTKGDRQGCYCDDVTIDARHVTRRKIDDVTSGHQTVTNDGNEKSDGKQKIFCGSLVVKQISRETHKNGIKCDPRNEQQSTIVDHALS